MELFSKTVAGVAAYQVFIALLICFLETNFV